MERDVVHGCSCVLVGIVAPHLPDGYPNIHELPWYDHALRAARATGVKSARENRGALQRRRCLRTSATKLGQAVGFSADRRLRGSLAQRRELRAGRSIGWRVAAGTCVAKPRQITRFRRGNCINLLCPLQIGVHELTRCHENPAAVEPWVSRVEILVVPLIGCIVAEQIQSDTRLRIFLLRVDSVLEVRAARRQRRRPCDKRGS